MGVDTSSKENRWYIHDIDGQIQPQSRKLLEEYSHIPAEKVDSHIYNLRDKLWSHAPYPCVGGFKFLSLNLPSHPKYPHVLSLLLAQKSPATPTAPPAQLLDLGCCVAQELRSLAYAGIPSSQLSGSDLNPGFLSTSYELFHDRDTFHATLVPGNVFEESIFDRAWRGWEGRFAIVHAGLFLHLFDWDQQLKVCEKIMKLLRKEQGSMFLGEMVGCEGGRESGEGRKQYLHDVETFERMWGEVAERTGTQGCWRVEGAFRKRGVKEGDDRTHTSSYFTGEGVGWLTFSVERI